jgi:hypothetical protein
MRENEKEQDESYRTEYKENRVAYGHEVQGHEWLLVNEVRMRCGHGVAVGVFGAPSLQA